MFNELFNGSPKFTYNADTNEYIGITDFLKEHDRDITYQVHGMFVTKGGQYGPRGIIILDGYNLYVPKHLNDTIQMIRKDNALVEAINAGHCGLKFRDYTKDGKTHTTVDFVDV